MHKLADIGIPTVFPIYIQDMGSVMKWFPCGQIHSLNLIDGFLLPKEILLGDKNRVGIRQALKRFSFVQVFHIHDAGMVSGTVWGCAPVSPLHLDIVFFPGSICGIRIQTNGSCSGHPLHIRLGFKGLYNQVGLSCDDSQHQLYQLWGFPKQAAHKVIINGPEAPQTLKVFLMLSFFSQDFVVIHCSTTSSVPLF